MNDNALITFIIASLNAGLSLQSISGVIVLQSDQPTVQGMPSATSIYIRKISSQRYGYLKRSDVWDAETNTMVHTEEQPIITTFQINATAIQNPALSTSLTAGDYVELAASILNSDVTREYLRANGIQVMRIKDGRQTYWKDDKGRTEADPSYDCAFVHSNIITTVTPSTADIIPGIYPV